MLVSKPVTVESLRAQMNALLAAERLVREVDLPTQANYLRREAEKCRKAAHAVATAVGQIDSDLSPSPDNDTIGTDVEGQTYRLVKKGLHPGPALKSRGPAAIVAKRLGLSLPKLARLIGVPYETLKKQDARKSLTEEVDGKLNAALAKAGKK